ncbi:MAG: hypothetical protein WA977_02365 [Halobacteriota archaeon]
MSLKPSVGLHPAVGLHPGPIHLVDSFEFTAKGALSMSSAEDDVFEFTAKGAFAMSSAEGNSFEFTALGALDMISNWTSIFLFEAKGALSMTHLLGIDLDTYPVKSITVSKSIQDIYWDCIVKMDGLVDVPRLEKEFVVSALDHNDVSRLLFGGLIPEADISKVSVSNETILSGWDHGFYLSVQKVPTGLRTIDKETNPKDVIEALLSQSGTAMTTVTDTFDSDIYATQCLREYGPDYDSVHDDTTGDIITGEVYAGQSLGASWYYIFRNVVGFDTSAIGLAGRVESAKLRLHIKDKDDFGDDDKLVIQNGQPDYPHSPLAVGDYSKTVMSGNGGEIAGSEIVDDRWIHIDLNIDGLKWINKTGLTKLYVRSQKDIDGEAPTADENIDFYADDAELIITYFPQEEPDWFWTTGIEPYNLKDVTNWKATSNIVFDTDIYATKCLRRWGSDFDYLHDAASGDIVTGEVYVGQSAPPSYYFIFRNPVGFDTSALGLGSKIVSAKLKIYIEDIDVQFAASDKLVIQRGQSGYPHDPLESGDYSKEVMSGNGGEIAGSEMSSGEWIEIELSNDGISWIDRVGTTTFYLRTQKDIDGPAPTGDENIEFSTGGAQLDITYYPETDIPKKSFEWEAETTKEEAIKDICKYCEFVFAVKPRENPEGPIPFSSGYFVHADEVDTELDLPAMVTITKDVNDAELISIPMADNKYAEKINRVIVRGMDPLTGNWFIASEETAEVTAKEERPIEFYYESSDLTSQGLTNAKAESLLSFYNHSPDIYKAQFRQRFDLQLYQKMKFVGFTKIPEEKMRITKIKYCLGAFKPGGPIIKQVEIGFTSDKQLSDLLALQRDMEFNLWLEVTKIIRETIKAKETDIAVGTVTEIDELEATVQLERDDTHIKARIFD